MNCTVSVYVCVCIRDCITVCHCVQDVVIMCTCELELVMNSAVSLCRVQMQPCEVCFS